MLNTGAGHEYGTTGSNVLLDTGAGHEYGATGPSKLLDAAVGGELPLSHAGVTVSTCRSKCRPTRPWGMRGGFKRCKRRLELRVPLLQSAASPRAVASAGTLVVSATAAPPPRQREDDALG